MVVPPLQPAAHAFRTEVGAGAVWTPGGKMVESTWMPAWLQSALTREAAAPACCIAASLLSDAVAFRVLTQAARSFSSGVCRASRSALTEAGSWLKVSLA